MGSIPAAGEEKCRCPTMSSLVSCAGMRLDKSVRRPLDRDVNWRTPVQGGSLNVQGVAVCIERKKERKKERLNKSYAILVLYIYINYTFYDESTVTQLARSLAGFKN